MRRAGLAVLLLVGLVACSPGEPASVASTGKWRPLAASTLARTEVAAARAGRFVYRICARRATGSAVWPPAAASTRSRAATSPGSTSPARSSTSI